jgi:hypothetical protein
MGVYFDSGEIIGLRNGDVPLSGPAGNCLEISGHRPRVPSDPGPTRNMLGCERNS